MDLLRLTGDGQHRPDNPNTPILFDRASFHSGEYFFTVVHTTSSSVIFEVMGTNGPVTERQLVEDVVEDELMEFKLSVYCRNPIIHMNYTIKESPIGDYVLLLDCSCMPKDAANYLFTPNPETHLRQLEPVLEYFGIDAEEDLSDYVIAADIFVPETMNRNLSIQEHKCYTSIRIGKVGLDLDDRILDLLYDRFIIQSETTFAQNISNDPMHEIGFHHYTTATLEVDQIRIDIASVIIGYDGIVFSNANPNSITCMIDKKIFPVTSNKWYSDPNLLQIAPFFYRKRNSIPYVMKLLGIKKSSGDKDLFTLDFKTKYIETYNTKEEYDSHKRSDRSTIQYIKIETIPVPTEESDFPVEVTIYTRIISRVEEHRGRNRKKIDPIFYAEVTSLNGSFPEEVLSTIGDRISPSLLRVLATVVPEPGPFPCTVIYSEQEKVHVVFW